MKKRYFMITALTVLLALIMLISAAHAANDDFEVTCDFSPDIAGYLGADMDLMLMVKNTGDTDITKVRVDIGTFGNFAKIWRGTIRPGRTTGIHFVVPFMGRDLDRTITMLVQINNDGDAAMDGEATFFITIRSADSVFSISSVISPPSGQYHPGDTVTIIMRYRNNITTHNANGVVTDANLVRDGIVLHDFPEDDQGIVMPEKYAVSSYTCTLTESDIGRVEVRYRLRAEIMGRDYDISGISQTFDVTEQGSKTTPKPSITPGTSATHTATAAPSLTHIVTDTPASTADAEEAATPSQTAAEATPAFTPEPTAEHSAAVAKPEEALPSEVTEEPAATQAQPPLDMLTVALVVIAAVLLIAFIALTTVLIRKGKDRYRFSINCKKKRR